MDELIAWERGRRGQRCITVVPGQRFGELVVVEQAPNPIAKSGRKSTGVYVFVRCDCGSETRMRLSNLTNRGVSACGKRSHFAREMEKTAQEFVGQRFGALVVVAAAREMSVKNRATQVLVRCDCGDERYARLTDLRGGGLKSCNGPRHRPVVAAKRWEVHGRRKTYAIEGVGTGLIKIGAARDFKSRLWKMQPVSPVELRIFAMCDDDIETRLHVMLEPHRAHGEWFHRSEDVMAAIEQNMEPTSLSVLKEFSLARRGRAREGKHRCKRCGDLGHHAKTCAKDLS